MWQLRKREKQGKRQNEDKAFVPRARLSNAELNKLLTPIAPPPPFCAFASLSSAAPEALVVILFPCLHWEAFQIGRGNTMMQGIHQGSCCISQWNCKEKTHICIPPSAIWGAIRRIASSSTGFLCTAVQIVGEVTMTSNHPLPPFHSMAFTSSFKVNADKAIIQHEISLDLPLLHLQLSHWLHWSRDKPSTCTEINKTLNKNKRISAASWLLRTPYGWNLAS